MEEIKIGNQIWIKKNLDVDTFRNGDCIPEVKTEEEWIKAGKNKQPAWCFYANEPANGAKYGKLYNWYAVNDPRGLAPIGYKIPSNMDWTYLTDLLGEDIAGRQMKSVIGWRAGGDGTNKSDFSGLPGGFRQYNGLFFANGIEGYWWSSTEDDSNFAYYICLDFDRLDAIFNDSQKEGGFSVRCVRE